MLKEITFNIEESLIQKAIQVANKSKTTLEAEFRSWLKQYVDKKNHSTNYAKLMKELSHVQAGHNFSRSARSSTI